MKHYIWQYSSIGSDNGLAPTRRQAFIWTNDDYASYMSILILNTFFTVLGHVINEWNKWQWHVDLHLGKIFNYTWITESVYSIFL